MSTSTAVGIESRVLNEGYGPVRGTAPISRRRWPMSTPALAFWRPAAGRHNIAEIALHHAYFVRAVRAQISGRSAEPFVLDGEDWFDLANETTLSVAEDSGHRRGGAPRSLPWSPDIEAGQLASPLAEAERFNLVLGITCHAIYHAGQIQLIKRLREQEK